MDCSLPGSCVHGIFQASVLEWAAIAFSVCAFYQHLYSDGRLKLFACEKVKISDPSLFLIVIIFYIVVYSLINDFCFLYDIKCLELPWWLSQ